MFERIMIVIITIIWIMMLLVLIGLFGWWLISELVSSVLKFLLII
jgi:hypothetical protein